VYKDDICVSVKSNIWYKYHESLEIDPARLRYAISNNLRKLYHNKMSQMQQKLLLSGTDVEDDKNPYKIKVKCVQIYERLGKSSEKKNIMTECKELSTTVRFEN
jgi:hypothetical protein